MLSKLKFSIKFSGFDWHLVSIAHTHPCTQTLQIRLVLGICDVVCFLLILCDIYIHKSETSNRDASINSNVLLLPIFGVWNGRIYVRCAFYFIVCQLNRWGSIGFGASRSHTCTDLQNNSKHSIRIQINDLWCHRLKLVNISIAHIFNSDKTFAALLQTHITLTHINIVSAVVWDLIKFSLQSLNICLLLWGAGMWLCAWVAEGGLNKWVFRRYLFRSDQLKIESRREKKNSDDTQ